MKHAFSLHRQVCMVCGLTASKAINDELNCSFSKKTIERMMRIEKTENVPPLSAGASALALTPENGSLRFDIYTNAETDLDSGINVDSFVAAHGLAHILLNYPDMVNNAYAERMKLFGHLKDEAAKEEAVQEEYQKQEYAEYEKEVERNSTKEKADA